MEPRSKTPHGRRGARTVRAPHRVVGVRSRSAVPEVEAKRSLTTILKGPIAFASACLALAGTLGTSIYSFMHGSNAIPILMAIAGVLLTVLLLLIIRNDWLNADQLNRASTVILGAMFLAYGSGPFLVEILGMPSFADAISWFAFLWILVVISECSIIVRVNTQALSDRIETIALIVAVSLVGTAIMGVAAAASAVAVRSFQSDQLLMGVTIVGEAVALTLLSLTILLGRRLVVAMAIFSYGPIAIGFGIASLLDKDAAFGTALVCVGILACSTGLAIALGNASVIGALLAIAGAACAFGAWSAWDTSLPGPALSLSVLAVALFLTGIAFWIWRPVEPWRQKNDLDAWARRRYHTVILTFLAISAGLGTAASFTILRNESGATAAFLSLLAGSLTVVLTTYSAEIYGRHRQVAIPRADNMDELTPKTTRSTD